MPSPTTPAPDPPPDPAPGLPPGPTPGFDRKMSRQGGHFPVESPSRDDLGCATGRRRSSPLDMKAIAASAEANHGVVSVTDLARLGVGRRAVSRWCRRGYLHRVQPGIYTPGSPHLSVRGHWQAAVLSFSCPAALSHLSAAALWGLSLPRLPIELTVAKGRGNQRDRVRMHESEHLNSGELTRREGIAVTTLPRTLLDLACRLPPDGLERMAEEALRLGVLDLRALWRIEAAATNRKGVVGLRLLLDRLDPDVGSTRSHGEVLLIRLCRQGNLPSFLVNATVGSYEVDILWPDLMLVLEHDGYRYHGSSAAHENDRRRDAELKAMGYEVLRISYRMLKQNPAQVLAIIRQVILRRQVLLSPAESGIRRV